MQNQNRERNSWKVIRVLLGKCASYVVSLSNWTFYPIVTVVFFIINVMPYIENPLVINYSTSILAGRALPEPVNFTSSNLIPALVYKLFNIEPDDYYGERSSGIFLALLILLTIAAYFFFIIAISKLSTKKNIRLVTLVLVFSPAHRFLALPFDMYDVFIYLGIAILFYGLVTHNHLNTFYVGTFLFVFSHPEQALASFTALLLLGLNKNFIFLRRLAIRSFFYSVITNFCIHLWYLIFGYKDARAVEIIFGFLPITLPGHLTNLDRSAWTIINMYGVLWLLVALGIKHLGRTRFQRAILIVSLAGAPLFFWFVTSDGLRCVVPMTTLLSFVLALGLNKKLDEREVSPV